MRIAKPGRIGHARISARLGALKAALSFIAFLAVLSAPIGYGLNLFKKPALPPITVAILGNTNSASDDGLTQVLVTNLGSRRYNYAFSTEVFTDGVWRNAPGERNNAASAIEMPPQSQRVLSLRIPKEGRVWRIKLVASRVLGKVEEETYQLFRQFKLQYPFAENFQVKGPEMLNRSVEATRPGQTGQFAQKS